MAAGNRDQFASYTISDAAATEYVRTTFNADRTQDLNVHMTFLNDRVQVNATASVPTTIANVLGFRTMPIGANAEAIYDSKFEIALVLDNTGSMAQSNKLATLKGAAHKFLSLMQSAATKPDSIKLAIVPFDTDVNLGGLSSSSWVDKTQISQWSTYPSTAGCIWDRQQPYDADDTTPSSVNNSLFSADASRTSPCSIGPILPLTTDYTALNASIDAMNAAGNTNITIGLVWGFHVLTPTDPITNAAALGAKGTAKYVILMTDGANTQNRFSKDSATINDRTRAVCSNLRSAGIKVFTSAIGVNPGDITSDAAILLQNCATDPSMAYQITDVSQFDPVFQSIYRAIIGTRIAR